MRLFFKSTAKKHPSLTKTKLNEKPFTDEIIFKFLGSRSYPDENSSTIIELGGRYLELPSEDKVCDLFPKLSFQAIIVYLDIISLVNLSDTQKSMSPYLLSPQCLFAFNQVCGMTALTYTSACMKLKKYIESNYCNLITDEKQDRIKTGKLTLYKAGDIFINSSLGKAGKKRLNKFLQDIFVMQNMPEACNTGCMILLRYVESVIIAKQGNQFPQMLVEAVKKGLFVVSPTEPVGNTQILGGEQAKLARQAITSITKTANAHYNSYSNSYVETDYVSGICMGGY